MNINLSTEPYYDDFDSSKHFHKILFKPGYAVQTRELNQLQSIIASQIDRFGSHIFTDGSVVHNGQHSCIKASSIIISSFTGTTDLNYFLDKIVYIGDIKKKVVHVDNSYTTNYIYTVDITAGDITAGSVLSIQGDTLVKLTVAPTSAGVVYGKATLHQIRQGIYFVQGSFVQVEDQIIIVSTTNSKISSDVYLVAIESIVNAYTDETLLDNVFGSPNYSAPGADRYAIDLKLQLSLPGTPLDTNNKHFLLASYRDGIIIHDVNAPQYSDLEKHLAERTYKESGNYTVDAFIGKMTPDLTDPTNTFLKLDIGDAFINGYEFKTEAPTLLSVPKARTTTLLNNGQLQIDKGPYVLVENISGFISPYSTVNIDIHSTINPNNTSDLYAASIIGTATCFGMLFDSFQTGSSNTYKLFLTDITMAYGKNFIDARSFIVKSGTTNYTYDFFANYSSETYDSKTILGTAGPINVKVFNALKYSNIYTLVNKPIKTHINPITNSNDISYQYYKSFISTTFSRDGVGFTYSNFSLTGNQVFIGSGEISSSSLVTEWCGVIRAVGEGSGIAPIVGSIVNFSKVEILDNINATATILSDFVLTLDVFVVISESTSITRNKVLVPNSILLLNSNLGSSSISLQHADGYRLVSVIGNDSVNYSSYYNFHTGQQDLYYDHCSITLKDVKNSPLSKNDKLTSLTVTFDYFNHIGTGPLTVDSYSTILFDKIPTYRFTSGDVLRLSDAIDFRPRRSDGSSTLLFDEYKKPHFGSTFMTDYEYYLSRIDLAVVSTDLKLSIISGIPSKYPIIPDPGANMTIYTISIPAYTFSYDDINAEFVDNRGYTMKDIAKIDKRVNRLEYYTALSLLEKQAGDESIPSSVPGIDKFKNGILVDPFAGHSVGDVYNSAYNCAIDFTQRYLRPAFNNSSYSYKFDSAGSNSVVSSNNHVTLSYTEVPVIAQLIASETESVQPFAVFSWNGIMNLDPPTDNWTDTSSRPVAIINMNGANDAYSVFAQGNGQKWSDWQTSGVGMTNLSLQTNVTVKPQVTIA